MSCIRMYYTSERHKEKNWIYWAAQLAAYEEDHTSFEKGGELCFSGKMWGKSSASTYISSYRFHFQLGNTYYSQKR